VAAENGAIAVGFKERARIGDKGLVASFGVWGLLLLALLALVLTIVASCVGEPDGSGPQQTFSPGGTPPQNQIPFFPGGDD
jgi:hypothetical protein